MLSIILTAARFEFTFYRSSASSLTFCAVYISCWMRFSVTLQAYVLCLCVYLTSLWIDLGSSLIVPVSLSSRKFSPCSSLFRSRYVGHEYPVQSLEGKCFLLSLYTFSREWYLLSLAVGLSIGEDCGRHLQRILMKSIMPLLLWYEKTVSFAVQGLARAQSSFGVIDVDDSIRHCRGFNWEFASRLILSWNFGALATCWIFHQRRFWFCFVFCAV